MPETAAAAEAGDSLDHLLILRGGGRHLFPERGVGGVDIEIHRGLPEPKANFVEGFADLLVSEGVCVECDAQGRTEDGEVHPTVIQRARDLEPVSDVGLTQSDPLPITEPEPVAVEAPPPLPTRQTDWSQLTGPASSAFGAESVPDVEPIPAPDPEAHAPEG